MHTSTVFRRTPTWHLSGHHGWGGGRRALGHQVGVRPLARVNTRRLCTRVNLCCQTCPSVLCSKARLAWAHVTNSSASPALLPSWAVPFFPLPHFLTGASVAQLHSGAGKKQ